MVLLGTRGRPPASGPKAGLDVQLLPNVSGNGGGFGRSARWPPDCNPLKLAVVRQSRLGHRLRQRLSAGACAGACWCDHVAIGALERQP
jgi:hypothetical protein